MGQFDRKAGKKGQEPDAPKSQKVLKKKSSSKLDSLARNKDDEKARNMKIFNLLERKAEIKAGGGAGKGAVAATDEQKILKKTHRKEVYRRQKS